MLESINDIGQGRVFPPESERVRVEAIRANRRLYNNDFSPLNIDVESDVILRKANWFRRVAQFYPEFVFSQPPAITLEDNARFTELYADHLQSILHCLSFANIDLLRYGTGVCAASPFDPLEICVYAPDSWFIVTDFEGNITADIIAYVENPLAFGTQRFIKVTYQYNGPETSVLYQVFKSNAEGVGELQRSVTYPARSGRQVLPFFLGYPSSEGGESLYDDMKESIAEITGVLSRLSQTLKRNLRPHLYGPENMLKRDETGKAQLDVKGMFLPLGEGDQVPGYLQWDSKEEAIDKDYNYHLDNLFMMTGLSRVLFEPGFGSGTISGSSLSRFLIPFVAKLNTLRALNQAEIQELVALLNRNRARVGLEVVDLDVQKLRFEWPYEQVFMDEVTSNGTSSSE